MKNARKVKKVSEIFFVFNPALLSKRIKTKKSGG
jgi:hypothetical protein